MCAYCPLAMKAFGAEQITVYLKLQLLRSLVLSRLLFNLHTVIPTKRFLSVLNDVYMRAIRRIHGCITREGGTTDKQARDDGKIPSIDCVIMQSRMRYLRRLLIACPPALMAILSTRAIMAMRGLRQKKHRLAVEGGTLTPSAKPISYKGNTPFLDETHRGA